MNEHKEPIPSRIYNSAIGGHVAGANDIYDDDLQKNQAEINAETYDGLEGKIPTSQKGIANGVATLDAGGKVPSSQIPSYLDNIINGYLYEGSFYKDSIHEQLITPENDKIYIDISSNKTYIWTGTAYNSISNPYIPDEEDLTIQDNKIKLKDKAYTPLTYSGMGRVILRKNIVNNVNILIQSMLTQTNTIYIIQYDFTISENITIPANCILKFDGGSIDGGGTTGLGDGHTVIFNNTVVTKHKNAFTNCRFAGSLATQQVFMSTFGVVADGEIDDSWVIQDVIDCAYGKSSEVFFDCDGDYLICTPSHHISIFFKSNTVYNFTGKGFIKMNSNPAAYTETGTITRCKDSENIIINNIRINGNFANTGGSGQNGLSIFNVKDVAIKGGIIKNCNRGDFVLMENNTVYKGDGGKGIQTENYGNQNILIDGVSFYNCSIAISYRTDYHADEYTPQIIHANNIYAENCPIFLYCGLINAETLDASLLNLSIENSTIKNCGWFKYGIEDVWHPDDYTGIDPENPNHSVYQDEGGVFVLDRATNLKLNNITIIGDKPAWNIFCGTHHDCNFNNIVINQQCTSVITIDQGPFNLDYSTCRNNYYKFIVNCNYTYLFSHIDSRSQFANVTFEILLMNIIKDVSVIEPTSLGHLSHGYKCNLRLIPVYKDYVALSSFDLLDGDLDDFVLAPVNGIVNNIHKFYIGDYSEKPYYASFGKQYLIESGEIVIPVWKSKTNASGYFEADGAEAAIARNGSTAVRQQQRGLVKQKGFIYFDTDINKPCFWNGTKYVLADGNDAPTT